MSTLLSESEIEALEQFAQKIRCGVVRTLVHARSGHLAGALGLAEVFAVLYGKVLHHRPEDPLWKDRDRLVLSNGHTVPARYVALALSGYFPEEELYTLRSFGARLQGHPEVTRLCALETTSGPLGEGLGQAAGMALGACLRGEKHRIFCVLSDAELQCGSTWEAFLFASAKRLSSLVAIIDRNNIQIGGTTEEVLPLEPLREKGEAFGWRVLEVDGHAIDMLCDACVSVQKEESPLLIIAHTTAGKGVPEIEGDYRWHGKVPDEKEADRFLSLFGCAR